MKMVFVGVGKVVMCVWLRGLEMERFELQV